MSGFIHLESTSICYRKGLWTLEEAGVGVIELCPLSADIAPLSPPLAIGGDLFHRVLKDFSISGNL